MVRHIFTTAIGKSVRLASRLRGGGSALPGLVVETIDRDFIRRTLSTLPHGVVIISGTNGKTTTTKIVVELLESAGLIVFTNRTGSNFSRGVAAALIAAVNAKGQLDADIAVLELDEAWAVKFVDQIKPRYSLLLNVMRDQLDRFGEIDTTAQLLANIAQATTDQLVLNRDDPRIAKLADTTTAEVSYFGTTTDLLRLLPTDDSLKNGGATANISVPADVTLTAIDEQRATFAIDGQTHQRDLQLGGAYNLLNAAAALTLVRQIVPQQPIDQLLDRLSEVKPAFGRGEQISYRGRPIDLILVKNPSGFRLALLSFPQQGTDTMIAINDNYADGRDMSWLWDVDCTTLGQVSMVSGTRAHDMALRLAYDEVPVNHTEPNLEAALEQLLDSSSGPMRIFCTYTAMTTLRKLLAEKTEVEDVYR